MALNTVSSDRLSTNVKNTNFTAAEKQDLTDDILPLAGQLGNRNLIINGAMQVAQRGTSSTASGLGTVDRFRQSSSSVDAALTQAQVDVASGTTPYTSGFRKAYKVTNANQTSGAATAVRVRTEINLEAQDIANSGWNYTSTSSFITLSFWIKSSVAQNFYGYIQTFDGTGQAYVFETGSLTANTWTKITKTIPGNSNLTFDNNENIGFQIVISQFMGTDYTESGKTLNQWAAYSGTSRMPDNISTWYTTNGATFEQTGFQLEVGSVATDFEHRSFGQELALCHRYYNKVFDMEGQSGEKPASLAVYENGSTITTTFNFPKMRAVPSIDCTNATNKFMVRSKDVSDNFNTLTFRYGTTTTAEITQSSNVSGDSGASGFLRGADTDVFIAFSAEL